MHIIWYNMPVYSQPTEFKKKDISEDWTNCNHFVKLSLCYIWRTVLLPKKSFNFTPYLWQKVASLPKPPRLKKETCYQSWYPLDIAPIFNINITFSAFSILNQYFSTVCERAYYSAKYKNNVSSKFLDIQNLIFELGKKCGCSPLMVSGTPPPPNYTIYGNFKSIKA